MTNEEFSKELSKISNELFNKIREEAIHEYLMQIDYMALKLTYDNSDSLTLNQALLQVLRQELMRHGYLSRGDANDG